MDKKELPLNVGGSQDVVLPEKSGIKQAIFHGQTDDTLHIIQFRTVKAVDKLLVKFVTDRDIIPLPGIDVRQRFHQCGKGRITFTSHNSAHHPIVHKAGAHGEIIQSSFYSSHSVFSFSFSCFREILSATT